MMKFRSGRMPVFGVRVPGFQVSRVSLSAQMQVQFNQAVIKRNWSSINRTPIREAGLKVMRKMRGLIRKARKLKGGGRSKKPSPPGRPPRARTSRGGSWPFKRIFSVPINHDSAAIIGHQGFGKKQTPMEIHEFGQTAEVKVIKVVRKRRRAKSEAQRKAARRLFKAGRIKEKQASRVIVTEAINYPKRPFAEPSLMLTKNQFPALWRNSVRKATVRNT